MKKGIIVGTALLGLTLAGCASTPSPTASTPSPAPPTPEVTAFQVWTGLSDSAKAKVCAADDGNVTQTFNDAAVPQGPFSSIQVSAAISCPKPEPTSTPMPKPKPKPKPKPVVVNYEKVSERTLAKIIRDPDGHLADTITVYGEITQYDSATGLDTFRANIASHNTTSYGYFDGENALITGEEGDFEDFIDGDVFKAQVLVSGSYTYDTQIGGSTTVPLFLVTGKITRIGHND